MKKTTMRSGLMATTTICSAILSAAFVPALVATVATSLSATSADAQDYTSGAVSIAVKDAKGAPVSGATVVLTSASQGITKTLTTGAGGTVTATGLTPGDYTVTVSAGGFETYSSTASVVVSQEVTYTYALNTAGGDNTVVVKAHRVRQDFNKTTNGLSVDLTTLVAQQPIGRSIEAVTLLAPTTVNSTAFGEPSVGGGSAAENAFYINGLNVTNPDTYIGGATVPFDFYKTIDVQTSGSPAEFGRATGGVVNATTKSGTNDFMFAVHGNFAPNSLRATPFATATTSSPVKYQKSDLDSISVESGGALIKDKLFLYGLVQLNDNQTQGASTTGGYLEKDKSTSPFYGLKGDWYITPGQHLELTYFDTTTNTTVNRVTYLCPTPTNANKTCPLGPTGQTGEVLGTTQYGAKEKSGGPSDVLKYTGNLTDWFTLSAAIGDTKDASDFTSANPSAYYVQTYDGINNQYYRTSVNQLYSSASTVDDWERKFERVDGDIRFNGWGKHHIRFGMDNEDLSMTKTTQLPGADPIRYVYRPTKTYSYIIFEKLGGKVSSKDSAFYIQDSWDVTSTLNLQIGYRDDDFKAKNLSGQQFLSLTGNSAPRLGLSWKPSEDSKWRFTAYYGQTYIPPAMNLGFRGKDLYFYQYFKTPTGGYTGIDPTTGIPSNFGAKPYNGIGNCPTLGLAAEASAPGGLVNAGETNCSVYGNGTQEPAAAKAAVGLKATRESEVDLGTYYRANDLWSFDLQYVYRSLDRVSEDTDFAPQINDYCASKGMTCSFSNEYHVWNVGNTVTLNTFSTLPDGEKQVTFTNLGFPKPKRDYWAVTFDYKRAFDGKWGLQGNVTWSKEKGNYEGTVFSTGSGSGQTDAGSTELYDYVHLSDYSNGTLINSRDLEFKAWGSYAITPDLLIGANLTVVSPGKLSCYGHYPDNSDSAYYYGDASHYCLDTSTVAYIDTSGPTPVNYYNYKPSPSGSGGKTDWQKTIDVSLRYTVPVSMGFGGKLILRGDIFNLFDDKEATALNENGDATVECGAPAAPGSKCVGSINPQYGTPTAYNNPRYMRVGFDLQY